MGLLLLIRLTWRMRQELLVGARRADHERMKELRDLLPGRLAFVDQQLQKLINEVEFAAGFDLAHQETRRQLAGKVLARVVGAKKACQVAGEDLREIRRLRKAIKGDS